MARTIITGGTVVTAADRVSADVLIEDEKIVALAAPGSHDWSAEETIEATGKYVIPGGIDVHTHMELPFGGTFASDTFETGTRAAAWGGTTTVVDFAVQTKGQGLMEGFEAWQEKASGQCAIDYGFHLIVGDVKHSRVARSNLHALRTLGAGEIRICGPASLLPDDDAFAGCTVSHDFDAALEGADALLMLRLQRERMEEGLVESLEDYHRDYGLTAARLRRAATGAVVLHPGPMNRGVEISDEVADGPQSLVLRQVANGVAVRMAVLERLLGTPA